LSLAQLAGPTQLIFYNNIILYNIRLGKNFKKKKPFKNLKFSCIFSYHFCLILGSIFTL
jgi:hypothetical protein